jgi:hypothetical protein
MSSRGMIAARQRTNAYRPSGAIAQHVIDTTIYDETINQPVIRCRAQNAFVIGRAVVLNGASFYLVASKFAHRYYVVAINKGVWTCSSKDERVASMSIDKASAYRLSLIEKMSHAA